MKMKATKLAAIFSRLHSAWRLPQATLAMALAFTAFALPGRAAVGDQHGASGEYTEIASLYKAAADNRILVTDYYPNENTWMEIDLEFGTSGNDGANWADSYFMGLVGFFNAEEGRKFNGCLARYIVDSPNGHWGSEAGNMSFWCVSDMAEGFESYLTHLAPYDGRQTLKLEYGKVSLSNATGSKSATSDKLERSGKTDDPVSIFGYRYMISAQPYHSRDMTIYSWKIYESNDGQDGGDGQELKCDFCPAHETASGKNGLYDQVSRKFYPLNDLALVTLSFNEGSCPLLKNFTPPMEYTAYMNAPSGVKLPDIPEVLVSSLEPPSQGKKFGGFFKAQSGGDQYYDAGGKAMRDCPPDGVTLYAVWVDKTYKISYNLNGGRFLGQEPTKTAVYGDQFQVNAPERTGYRFVGWHLSNCAEKATYAATQGGIETEITLSDGSGVVECTGDIWLKSLRPQNDEGTVTLTAQWVKVYTITFRANGGTNVDFTLDVASGVDLPNATQATSPQEAEGVHFTGYYDINDVQWYDADGKPFADKSPYELPSNITLYAHWDAKAYYKVGGDDVNNISSFEKSGDPENPTNAVGWALYEGGTPIVHTVSSGCDYYVQGSGADLRTPEDASSTVHAFAGKSLMIAHALFLRGNVSFASLISNGGIICNGRNNQTITVSGAIEIPDGQTLELDIARANPTLNIAATVTGDGTIRLMGEERQQDANCVYLLSGDFSDFTGNIGPYEYEKYPLNGCSLVFTASKFNGRLEGVPSTMTNVCFNYGALDSTTGLPIGEGDEAVNLSADTLAPLKTRVTLYSDSADFDQRFFPLMTFPEGTAVDPTQFTVSHATSTNGEKTAFANLGVRTNGDGSITLVANSVLSAIRENGPEIHLWDVDWIAGVCPGEKTAAEYQAAFLTKNPSGVATWQAYVLGYEPDEVATAAILEESVQNTYPETVTIRLRDWEAREKRTAETGCTLRYTLLSARTPGELMTGGGTVVTNLDKTAEFKRCLNWSFEAPLRDLDDENPVNYYRIKVHFIFGGGGEGGEVVELYSLGSGQTVRVGEYPDENWSLSASGGSVSLNSLTIPEEQSDAGYLRVTYTVKSQQDASYVYVNFCQPGTHDLINRGPGYITQNCDGFNNTKGGTDTHTCVYRIPPTDAFGSLDVRWQKSDGLEISNVKVESIDYLEAAKTSDEIFATTVVSEALEAAKAKYLDANNEQWTRNLTNLRKALKGEAPYDTRPYNMLILGDSLSGDMVYGCVEALVKRQFPDSNLRIYVVKEDNTGCVLFMTENSEGNKALKQLEFDNYDGVVFAGTSQARNTAGNKDTVTCNAVAGLADYIRDSSRNPGCEIIMLSPMLSVDSRMFKNYGDWDPTSDSTPQHHYWDTTQVYAGQVGAACAIVDDWDITNDGWAAIDYAAMPSIGTTCETKSIAYWDLYKVAYDYLFRSGKTYAFYSRDAQHANAYGQTLTAHLVFEAFKIVGGVAE